MGAQIKRGHNNFQFANGYGALGKKYSCGVGIRQMMENGENRYWGMP
jgi:hypothetical protein